MAKEIREGRLDPRTLTVGQRREVLCVIADGKVTPKELAHFLKTSRSRIHSDLAAVRKTAGTKVIEWGIATTVGYLKEAADECYAQAFKDGDVGMAFSIRRDLVRSLKELGVIGADAKDGIKITIESIGAGYERALDSLELSMDPLLTGEKVDPRSSKARHRTIDVEAGDPALPLEETLDPEDDVAEEQAAVEPHEDEEDQDDVV